MTGCSLTKVTINNNSKIHNNTISEKQSDEINLEEKDTEEHEEKAIEDDKSLELNLSWDNEDTNITSTWNKRLEQNDKIFVNEWVLFSRTWAIEFFWGEEKIKNWSSIPIKNYEKLQIIWYIWEQWDYSDTTVVIIKKEKTLSELLRNKNIDDIKTYILIETPRMDHGISNEWITLDYDIPNVIDSTIILSLEWQACSEPVINILLETEQYLIWIYKDSTCRNNGEYLQECKNIIENIPCENNTLHDDFLYYKNELENNKIFNAEIEKEILDTIKLFEIIKK